MIREAIETSAAAIELLAVGTIVIAVLHGTVRYFLHLQQRADDAYERYKVQLGRALLLGLEFLVAADIVKTSGTILGDGVKSIGTFFDSLLGR